MGDDHSAHHNASLAVALPTPWHSVCPLCPSSGFLFINASEICIHLLNSQLEPEYHGKYRAPMHAIVHPMYMFFLQLLCLKNFRLPLYIAMGCIPSCVLSSNALKSGIIASECFPSWLFWGPMNWGFAYDLELRGAAR